MRLGVLGPAQGDLGGLARAAQRLLDDVRPERVLYLGDDDALDRVVAGWAASIVGVDASQEGLFERAVECAYLAPDEIDHFVESERARLRLRVFVSLPEGRRTIELMDGRVVLFVHDKGVLDEEDILAASVVVFGRHEGALVKPIGARHFVSPGRIGGPSGVGVLDDAEGALTFECFAPDGSRLLREVLAPARAARMRVQGAG